MLEDNSSLNVEDLCRLCSFNEPTLKPIFGPLQHPPTNDIPIIDKISLCLPVQIKEEDSVSKKICTRCAVKVEEFYEFWNNTAQTQEIFENLARKLGIRENEVVRSPHLPNHDADGVPDPEEYIKEECELNYEKLQVEGQRSNSGDCTRNVPSADAAIQTEPLILIIKKASNSEDRLQLHPGLIPITKSGQSSISNLQAVVVNSTGLSSKQNLQPTTVNSLHPNPINSPGLTPINNLRPTPINKPALTPINNRQPASINNLQLTPINKPKLTSINSLQPTAINIPALTPINNRQPPPNNKPLQPSINNLPPSPLNIPALTPINNRRTASVNNLQVPAMNQGILVPNNNKKSASLPGKDNLYRTTIKLIERRLNGSKRESHVCKYCSKVCKNKCYLEVHLRRHTGERPFKCSVTGCNKAFYTKGNLQSHTQHCHTDTIRLNACFYCNKAFKTPAQLKIHTRIHVGAKSYRCKYCHFSTFEKASLEAHTRRHTKNYLVECNICGKGFYRKYAYQNHLVSHTGLFFCKDCNEPYPSISKLQYHRNKVHKLKEGPVTCSYCFGTFATKPSLKVHIRKIHIGVKYECYECGLNVSSKASLIVHLRKHSGEKPFKCRVCNKRFVTKTVLKQHYVVHTKERKYSCHICNKHYSQKSSLNIHNRKMHRSNCVDDISTFCEVKLEALSEMEEESSNDVGKQS